MAVVIELNLIQRLLPQYWVNLMYISRVTSRTTSSKHSALLPGTLAHSSLSIFICCYHKETQHENLVFPLRMRAGYVWHSLAIVIIDLMIVLLATCFMGVNGFMYTCTYIIMYICLHINGMTSSYFSYLSTFSSSFSA